MRQLRHILVAALALAVAPGAGAKKHLETLVGTRWQVHVQAGERTKSKDERSYDDVVFFAEGQLRAEVTEKQGFTPGAVDLKKDGNKWLFTSLMTGEPQTTAKATWTGDVREDWIAGTLVVVTKDGEVLNYLIKGRLIKDDAKGKKK